MRAAPLVLLISSREEIEPALFEPKIITVT
jgi:hypothetical protein